MLLLIVIVIVAFVSLGLLAVVFAALLKYVKALAETVKRFQQEVQPLLEQLNRDAARAQQRSAGLAEARSEGTLGARLRKGGLAGP